MSDVIPLVGYLHLEPTARLVANECLDCSARFLDRRSGCAACGGDRFHEVDLPTEGTVRAFTIVSVAAPDIPVPFIAAYIDLDGTRIAGNVVNCPADPQHVTLGMRVRLTAYSIGRDAEGVEAIGFGFEPSRP